MASQSRIEVLFSAQLLLAMGIAGCFSPPVVPFETETNAPPTTTTTEAGTTDAEGTTTTAATTTTTTTGESTDTAVDSTGPGEGCGNGEVEGDEECDFGVENSDESVC